MPCISSGRKKSTPKNSEIYEIVIFLRLNWFLWLEIDLKKYCWSYQTECSCRPDNQSEWTTTKSTAFEYIRRRALEFIPAEMIGQTDDKRLLSFTLFTFVRLRKGERGLIVLSNIIQPSSLNEENKVSRQSNRLESQLSVSYCALNGTGSNLLSSIRLDLTTRFRSDSLYKRMYWLFHDDDLLATFSFYFKNIASTIQ